MSKYLNPLSLPFRYTNTGNIPFGTVLADWDLEGLDEPSLALHVVTLGVSGALAIEFSGDEVNWTNGFCEPAYSGTFLQQVTSSGLYTLPIAARFMRLRMNSGTTGGTTTLSVTPGFLESRTITGFSAHGSQINSNPLRLAGRARTAAYSGVSQDSTADLVTTTTGSLLVLPYAIPQSSWQYAAGAGGIVDTTPVVIKAAVGGLANYITSLDISNNNSTETEVTLSSNSVVLWRSALGKSATISVTFPVPLRVTTVTDLLFTCLTAGAKVYVNAQGYNAP